MNVEHDQNKIRNSFGRLREPLSLRREMMLDPMMLHVGLRCFKLMSALILVHVFHREQHYCDALFDSHPTMASVDQIVPLLHQMNREQLKEIYNRSKVRGCPSVGDKAITKRSLSMRRVFPQLQRGVAIVFDIHKTLVRVRSEGAESW